ncbi:MAG: hypothetical protein GY847_21325 [Proteobacteria bacterium]|nr:hypothetical protein [Pseudomonadota bacterium]
MDRNRWRHRGRPDDLPRLHLPVRFLISQSVSKKAYVNTQQNVGLGLIPSRNPRPLAAKGVRMERYVRYLSVYVLTVTLGIWGSCQNPDKKQPSQAIRATQAPRAANPQQTPELLDYVEMLTAGAKAQEQLPLIVAVHGLGDRPEHFRSLLVDLPVPARVVLPRAPIDWGRGHAWFETRIASGDFDELATGIARAANQNAELVAYLIEKRSVRGRPIFMGFSQGGMVSYAMALHHPQNLGIVIPISGFLPKPLWPDEKKPNTSYPPIRGLHGSRDSLVPAAPIREAVKHLTGLGFDVKLTEYPDVSHTVSTGMRAELFRLIEEAVKKM